MASTAGGEGCLVAKIEGLEREMAEMRLEMRELRATMGEMMSLLSQFAIANSSNIQKPSLIRERNEAEKDSGSESGGDDDHEAEKDAHPENEGDDHTAEEWVLPAELWLHILGFVAHQQRNAEDQVCVFASLSSSMLVSHAWRKLSLSLVNAYILPPTKPKKLIRRCLPFIFLNCPNLKELCLRQCPVVDSMLVDIPEGLVSLDCAYTQITDQCIEHLPSSLKALHLTHTAITGEGVVELPPSIEVLSLEETGLTSQQFQRIKHRFPRLRAIYLSALQKLVPANRLPPSLHKLSLHPGSSVTGGGGGLIDSGKRFLYNDRCLNDLGDHLRHLTHLNLFHVNLTDAGMRKLRDLSTVTSLHIVGGLFGDAGLVHLPPALTSLRIARTKGVTDAGLHLIPASVATLGLAKLERVTAEGIVHYARTNNVPRLQVVVEKTMLSAILFLVSSCSCSSSSSTSSSTSSSSTAVLSEGRVALSTDKRLFYERGGCGVFYR